MANLLICINDKQRGWPIFVKLGSVYTEVDRYRHCGKGMEYVRIAEHEVPCPKKRYYCRCGQPSALRMAGMFAAWRFKPILPPKALGITAEEVRKLYGLPPRIQIKEIQS